MYNKKYIDIITLAVSILIFILLNFYGIVIQSKINKLFNQNISHNSQVLVEKDTSSDFIEEKVEDNTEISDLIVEEIVEEEHEELEEKEIEEKVDAAIIYPESWNIIIPAIGLVAPIEHGTTEEVLDRAVGHFEESPIYKGNVCLAAHNRGYTVNYFEKIKQLTLNDIIIYQCDEIEKVFSVSNMTIINETDWSYIKDIDENQITLITCVEDEPEYRLCVQATEIK